MSRFEELMVRVREGDADAGRELFEKYGNLLLKVVRRHLNPALRSQVDSTDFIQEAWLAFLQNPDKKLDCFDSPQKFGAFLATIARNKVVDVVRRGLMSAGYNVNREVRRSGRTDTAVIHCETPSKSAIRRELQEILIEGLGPAYRAIALKIFQGIDPGVIAEEFDINRRTVERVRERIVKHLGTL